MTTDPQTNDPSTGYPFPVPDQPQPAIDEQPVQQPAKDDDPDEDE